MPYWTTGLKHHEPCMQGAASAPLIWRHVLDDTLLSGGLAFRHVPERVGECSSKGNSKCLSPAGTAAKRLTSVGFEPTPKDGLRD